MSLRAARMCWRQTAGMETQQLPAAATPEGLAGLRGRAGGRSQALGLPGGASAAILASSARYGVRGSRPCGVIVCVGSGDQVCQEFGRREHSPAAVVYTRSLWAASRWALCWTTRVSLEGAGRNFVGVGN